MKTLVQSSKSIEQESSTLMVIESRNGLYTFYIDYDPEKVRPYSLYRDEKFIRGFDSFGEAVQSIINKVGMHFKIN